MAESERPTPARLAVEASYIETQCATTVASSSRDHGPRHWRDVARIGLGFVIEPVDRSIVFYFAALHDAFRLNEYSDPSHGRRAADCAVHLWVHGRLRGIPSNEVLTTLTYALYFHDTGEVSDNAAVAACWDADRLTMTRVGHELDPTYFSREQVRDDLMWYAQQAKTLMHGDDMTWEEVADRGF